MNCQVDIAKAIVAQDADYLFALKENHPHLQGNRVLMVKCEILHK
jgi:hypothetical protein